MFWVVRIGRRWIVGIVCASLLVGGAALRYWVIPAWHRLNGPLSGTVVVVDPGHGGVDGGASHGGVLEKEITLAIAQQAARLLRADGARTVLTRTKDEELSRLFPDEQTRQRRDLSARAQTGWEERANLLVSIHANAAGSAGLNGAVTFYQGWCEPSRHAADYVQRALEKVMPGSQNGIIAREFYLLERAACPAILVETGFLTSEVDRARLVDPEAQRAIAGAIADGIGAYLASARTGISI